MIEPYYKTELGELYNGDCLDVIEQIGTVDLIATDPPYRTTARGNAGNSGGMLQKKINIKGKVFENNSINIETWLPRCYDILKDSGHFYIMCNHKNLHKYLDTAKYCGLKFIKSLIWDKGNKIMGGFYMSQFEYILFFRKGTGVRINNCGTSDILSIPNIKSKDPNGGNLHDTEKPIKLMDILICNSTKPGETVFEPFAGIGSTVIASELSGRKWIGSEIDPIYCKVAAERISSEKRRKLMNDLL